MAELVTTVTLDDVAKALRDLGFRAELATLSDGRRSIRSATGGVAFNVVAGNATDSGLLDYTFFTSFRIDPPMAGLADTWNRGRRFARLYPRDDGIGIEMDVLIADGVGPAYVRTTIEIWNRLVDELLAHMRSHAAGAVTPAGAVRG